MYHFVQLKMDYDRRGLRLTCFQTMNWYYQRLMSLTEISVMLVAGRQVAWHLVSKLWHHQPEMKIVSDYFNTFGLYLLITYNWTYLISIFWYKIWIFIKRFMNLKSFYSQLKKSKSNIFLNYYPFKQILYTGFDIIAYIVIKLNNIKSWHLNS